MNDYPKIVKSYDGHTYLAFENNYDLEVFLESLKVDIRNIQIFHCGNYENAIRLDYQKAYSGFENQS